MNLDLKPKVRYSLNQRTLEEIILGTRFKRMLEKTYGFKAEGDFNET